MSAQEYYRVDHTSRPLSPPTNALHDTSGNIDRYNPADVNELTDGAPERVTAANLDSGKFNTTPSPPPHERTPSGFSDTPGYGRTSQVTYDEEANNPYGKNYNMANDGSKEALVPEAHAHGRSNGYQDLGAYSHSPPSFFISTYSCADSSTIRRVRGREPSRSGVGTSDGARRQREVWSVDGEP